MSNPIGNPKSIRQAIEHGKALATSSEREVEMIEICVADFFRQQLMIALLQENSSQAAVLERLAKATGLYREVG